jgi:hypothetical protein
MLIIGVAGDRGAGKNTFADLCGDYIRHDYPSYNYKEASWAYLLKKSAAASLGFELEAIDDNDLKIWSDGLKLNGEVNSESISEVDGTEVVVSTRISGREFLQRYGTEAHREIFGTNFWVDAFWEVNDFQDNDIVFVCDTRFENEAQSIKDRGGIIVEIVNDRINNEDSHASELGLPREYIDIIVDNSSTIDNLEASAETFVDSIKELKNG